MRFTPKQYAQALLEALETTSPKDQDKVLDNFVRILQMNNDLSLFEQVAMQFHKLDLEKKGMKQALVSSAHNLNEENEKQIINVLNKLLNTKVELKEKIDDRLVGGILIEVDDLMVDASVRNSLNQLKQELSQ